MPPHVFKPPQQRGFLYFAALAALREYYYRFSLRIGVKHRAVRLESILFTKLCELRKGLSTDAPDSNQPHLPGQKLLHHALLNSVALIAALLQRGNFRVDLGKNGGNGLLLFTYRQPCND